MPTLARACKHPGCPRHATRGSYRCSEHSAAQRAHEPQRPRESAARRGYDRTWRRVRAQFLTKHPACCGTLPATVPGGIGSRCDRPATEVDHVTALADGGTHAWSNLQPFCKSCHSRKTAAENRGAAGRIRSRTDGAARHTGHTSASGPHAGGGRAGRISGPEGSGDRGGSEIFVSSGFGSQVAAPDGSRRGFE